MIERYFSVCGFTQNKRKQNITENLFIAKCLLRANIKILNEINKSGKEGIESDFQKIFRIF